MPLCSSRRNIIELSERDNTTWMRIRIPLTMVPRLSSQFSLFRRCTMRYDTPMLIIMSNIFPINQKDHGTNFSFHGTRIRDGANFSYGFRSSFSAAKHFGNLDSPIVASEWRGMHCKTAFRRPHGQQHIGSFSFHSRVLTSVHGFLSGFGYYYTTNSRDCWVTDSLRFYQCLCGSLEACAIPALVNFLALPDRRDWLQGRPRMVTRASARRIHRSRRRARLVCAWDVVASPRHPRTC